MANKPARCAGLVLVAMALFVSGCVGPRTRPAPPRAAGQPEILPPGYERSYEVFGRRYYVMSSGSGYQATGIASWYGPKFNGRPTASGEIYDMHQMTAAHKSLPLQTVVQVTNLHNQRSVVVRVNDRGPFIGDRLIDMSYGAAAALDMIGAGTVPVEVVVLADHGAAATSATSLLPPVANAYIQVGAFADSVNARNLAVQLEQSGFGDVIIQEFELNNRVMQRVKIGPLPDSADRQQLLDRLAALGLSSAHIVSQ